MYKMCDFSESIYFDYLDQTEDIRCINIAGTIAYMSPEIKEAYKNRST